MDNQQNNPSPNGENGNNGKFPKNQLLIVLIAAFITFAIAGFMRSYMADRSQKEITYDEFVAQVENGDVEAVTIKNTQIDIQYKEDSKEFNPILKTYTVPMERDYKLTDRLLEGGVEIRRERQDSMAMIESLVSFVLPFILIVVMMNFMMKRMGGVGKSTAKMYMQKETGVTFADVAGEDEAKESLVELVDFLHNPGKYTHIGAKLPKGALLVGPPGTGKTLLAKAVAGEAEVPFFFLSGSDFMEMYVGVGASRVRSLFKQAQQNSPCIIFIDEIDSIGRSRSGASGGGESEQQQTLNQLLSEMDGMDTSKGLLILAATNRPEVLDPALLRPGRFDRRVSVDRPDLKGRVEILKVHAKNVALDETVDLHAIALATAGAVGSDLANMINEAAILAVKNGRNAVCQKDLFEAVEVVLVGKEKKDRVLSKEERSIVSYHEVGHALVSALQKDAEPVQKITIVPRTMGALGYVLNVPEEEKYLNSKKELEAQIVVFLAGRAAEEIVFNSVTTGAANDIEKATSIARAMVTQYGMSDKFGLMGLATRQDQYLSGRTVMDCGEATAAAVDDEVMRILKDSYEEAKRLLLENRDVLDQIAAFLIEKETITGKEFMQIFRKCKGIPEPEETERNGNTESVKPAADAEEQAPEAAEVRQQDHTETADSVEAAEVAGTPEEAPEPTSESKPEQMDEETPESVPEAETEEETDTESES